ncbi:MAG: hypothetical protein V1487_00740 [bacterium]
MSEIFDPAKPIGPENHPFDLGIPVPAPTGGYATDKEKKENVYPTGLEKPTPASPQPQG